MGYTAELDEEKTSKAIGKELQISPKKSVEVCRVLRGMKVEDAKEFLGEVAGLRKAVPYRRYRKCVAHKKGMAAGGYPRRVAKEILKVIQSAQENAEYKGLDSESMRIAVIASHKGRPIKRSRPRAHGRSSKWNQETVNIELILEEVE